MKLSNEEQQEINCLRELQQGYIPMMQKDFDRLKYLNHKEFHNCCPNPHCTGHEGTEEEIICPKCKRELMKLIKF